MFLYHIGRYKADATIPILWRVIEYIVNVKPVIFFRKGVEVILEENIVRVDVCENKIDLSIVLSAIVWSFANDGFDNL